VDFQAMLDMKKCPVCDGRKLRIESLNVFINVGKKKYNIAELQKLTLDDLSNFFERYIDKSNKSDILVNRITRPLLDRLQTIQDLWLGYIDLSRTMDTLSGWEIQRLRLAKQLGNKLTGIIYVLDEPTIGLSQKEIDKAIKAIRNLQLMWNTVIVVEHNESFIKAADWVVEIWPWAWDFGGKLVFNGNYDDFLKSKTLTAQYVSGKKKVNIDFDHSKWKNFIKIKKANKYNLKNLDINIRLWWFTVITGPSGAGKTTLMYTTLFRFLNDKQKFIQSFIRLQLLKKWMSWDEIIFAPIIQKDMYEHYENLALQEFYKDLAVDTIQGYEEIKNTIYVDQTSIGKTPRSCPATFIGTFDKIRALFAGTTQAKYLWFSASYFSFNSAKW
jgi:excinuclease ABC subunit A